MSPRRCHQHSVVSAVREYCDENNNQLRSYWDDENLSIDWSPLFVIEIILKIDRGKYSKVFEVYDIKKHSEICNKILKSVMNSKMKWEIKTNIIQLSNTIKDTVSRILSLQPRFTDFDVKHYINEILKALDYCHSCSVMHRDTHPIAVCIDCTL